MTPAGVAFKLTDKYVFQRRLLFLAVYWNQISYSGHFDGEILGLFHTIEWKLFETRGIYTHRIIEENVQHKYVGTGYSSWSHKITFS